MAEQERRPDTALDPEQLATARVAYQGAIAAWTYEGTGLWAVFSAMVTANSVVIAIATFLWERPLTSLGGRTVWLTPIISLIGFLLCIAWASMTSRRHQIHNYRVLAARELEEQHLSGVARTLANGGIFSDGEKVTLRVGGTERPLKMRGLGRFQGKRVMMSSILLFGALHVILGGARTMMSSDHPPTVDQVTALTTMLQQEMKRGSDLEAERARLFVELRAERDLREKLQQMRMPRRYAPKYTVPQSN